MKTCTVKWDEYYPEGCKGSMVEAQNGYIRCLLCDKFKEKRYKSEPQQEPYRPKGWTIPSHRLPDLSREEKRDPNLTVI